jgi:8-oxo-dGTP pyrophosphatase MutT (NUDIX family)
MSNEVILSTLAHHLETLPIRRFTESGIRRASVAAVIRCTPNSTVKRARKNAKTSLDEWLKQDWVRQGTLQILFMRRAVSKRDRWSGNVSFPGGKVEKDETDKEAAIRECFEEVGLNIDNPDFLSLGELDNREIRSLTDGRKPLMIMCSFVFLQLGPETPELKLSEKEVQSTHWMDLKTLLEVARDTSSHESWKCLEYDIASLVMPKVQKQLSNWKSSNSVKSTLASFTQRAFHAFFGKVSFGGIEIDRLDDWESVPDPSNPSTNPILWGLTLWVVSDLLDLCCKADDVPPTALHSLGRPSFSAYDVRMLLNVFHGNLASDVELRKPMRTVASENGELVPNDDGTIGEFASPKSNRLAYATALKLALVSSVVLRLVSSFLVFKLLRKFV